MEFYQGGRRPLTEVDVASLNHPGAVTAPVYVYQVNDVITLGTTCPRLAASRVMLCRLHGFVLPSDAVLIETVIPANQLCVDEC